MKTYSIALAGFLASTPGSFAGTSAAPLESPIIAPAGASDTRDEWSFELSPYVWVASIGSDTSLPWNGPDEPDSVQRLDTKITGAFMIEAVARYRSFGLLADFNWLRLDTETLREGTLYSGADLQTDYIYTTAGLTYALPLSGSLHADLLAGARLWSISADFDLKSGLLDGYSSSHSKTWVNPVIGANLSYELTPKWSLLAQGVWGGFTNSSTQWDVFGGFGYQFNDWCSGSIGYRYLSEEFDSSNRTFNIEAQGAQLGLRFKF